MDTYGAQLLREKALAELKAGTYVPSPPPSKFGEAFRAFISVSVLIFFAYGVARKLVPSFIADPPLLIVFIALAGIGVYKFKNLSLTYYGLSAMAVALGAGAKAAFDLQSTGGHLRDWVVVIVAVFGFARGVDDFSKGRKETARS